MNVRAGVFVSEIYRRHPNDTAIRNCIMKLRQNRICRTYARLIGIIDCEFVVLGVVAVEPTVCVHT